MRILFIDNYDSFTFNVVELLRPFAEVELTIVKNDELEGVSLGNFDRLIISPGPNLPFAANGLMEFLNTDFGIKPTLGICLGHQAIAQIIGGKLKQYENPKHGEKQILSVLKQGVLFKDLPPNFEVGLYHSWYVNKEGLPDGLQITAENEDGIIMAMQHKELPIHSVQFHPESFMSEYGREILHNFLYS